MENKNNCITFNAKRKQRKSIIRKIFYAFNLVGILIGIYNKYKYLTDFKIKSRNVQFTVKGAPDGLPLPPPQLVYLITGNYNIEGYYYNGVQGAESIRSILVRNGLNIDTFEAILDFGCGCGRIIRNWSTLSGPKFYGTDYNPKLINWCQRSLNFAEFRLNKLYSTLEYEDNKFDFIYVISVFTHLTEKLQKFWITELARILKKGGLLLIATHGTTRLHELPHKERREFEKGQLIVLGERFAGTNLCAAYHAPQYIRNNWTKELVLVDFIPGGAKDVNQDAYLLRKPIKDQ